MNDLTDEELGEIVRTMVTAVQSGNEHAWRHLVILGSDVDIDVRLHPSECGYTDELGRQCVIGQPHFGDVHQFLETYSSSSGRRVRR